MEAFGAGIGDADMLPDFLAGSSIERQDELLVAVQSLDVDAVAVEQR